MKKKFKYILISSLILTMSMGVGIGLGVKYALKHDKQQYQGVIVGDSENNTSKISNNSLNQFKSLRIGFWNVLNYINKENSAKSLAIADVINYNKADLVGLAEIKPQSDGSIIVDDLNKLDPKAEWAQLTTESEGKPNQKERYTFLYKKSLLEIIDFNSSKTNPYLIAKTTFEFARPVVAVKFQTKGDIKNDFTVALDHFDAPGPNKKHHEASSSYSEQGEQEVKEGEHLIDALNYVDENDGSNNEIIFMGDTNIKGKNHSGVFANTLKTYRSLLSPNDLSSLGKYKNKYSNSYDKIFYKGDLKTRDAEVFDLWSVFDKNIIDEDVFQNLKKKDNKLKHLKDIESKIRTGISDHAPVFFTLELDKNDKD